MAQGGLHALIGTVIVKATGKDAAEPGRAVAAKSFAFGFVTGNVLPDVDLAALALASFFDRDLALKMHRTATHSLVVIALFTTIGLLFSTTRGGRSFFQGLGMGMVLHVLFDVLMWFSPVDILWPLGRFGIPSDVNLWTWFSLPRLWLDLLGSTDFLLMALFYQYLLGRGRRYGTSTVRRIRRLVVLPLSGHVRDRPLRCHSPAHAAHDSGNRDQGTPDHREAGGGEFRTHLMPSAGADGLSRLAESLHTL